MALKFFFFQVFQNKQSGINPQIILRMDPSKAPNQLCKTSLTDWGTT